MYTNFGLKFVSVSVQKVTADSEASRPLSTLVPSVQCCRVGAGRCLDPESDMNTTCSRLPTPQVRLRGAESARRKTRAVLPSNDQEAAILAGRLIAAQEQERHRIARELHDNVGQ